jgi:hypothetical protein
VAANVASSAAGEDSDDDDGNEEDDDRSLVTAEDGQPLVYRFFFKFFYTFLLI